MVISFMTLYLLINILFLFSSENAWPCKGSNHCCQKEGSFAKIKRHWSIYSPLYLSLLWKKTLLLPQLRYSCLVNRTMCLCITDYLAEVIILYRHTFLIKIFQQQTMKIQTFFSFHFPLLLPHLVAYYCLWTL